MAIGTSIRFSDCSQKKERQRSVPPVWCLCDTSQEAECWKDPALRHPGGGTGRAAADGNAEDACFLAFHAPFLSRRASEVSAPRAVPPGELCTVFLWVLRAQPSNIYKRMGALGFWQDVAKLRIVAASQMVIQNKRAVKPHLVGGSSAAVSTQPPW